MKRHSLQPSFRESSDSLRQQAASTNLPMPSTPASGNGVYAWAFGEIQPPCPDTGNLSAVVRASLVWPRTHAECELAVRTSSVADPAGGWVSVITEVSMARLVARKRTIVVHALQLDPEFMRGLSEYLTEHFGELSWTAELEGEMHATMDSLDALLEYDNLTHRRIRKLKASGGSTPRIELLLHDADVGRMPASEFYISGASPADADHLAKEISARFLIVRPWSSPIRRFMFTGVVIATYMATMALLSIVLLFRYIRGDATGQQVVNAVSPSGDQFIRGTVFGLLVLLGASRIDSWLRGYLPLVAFRWGDQKRVDERAEKWIGGAITVVLIPLLLMAFGRWLG